MVNKKILLVFAIAILAVGMVSCASAADGTIENIRGIDFNIPSDFVKSDLSVQDNETNIATTDICLYTDSNNDIYSIMVIEYKSAPSDSLLKEGEDGEKTTIKNIDGYIGPDSFGDLVFKYLDGNCLVEVSAPTQDKIEEILIGK